MSTALETETEVAIMARRVVASIFALLALVTVVHVVRGDEALLASLERAPQLVVAMVVLHTLLAVSLWRGPRFAWIARGVGWLLLATSPGMLVVGANWVGLLQGLVQGGAILLALLGPARRARVMGAGVLGALCVVLRLVTPPPSMMAPPLSAEAVAAPAAADPAN